MTMIVKLLIISCIFGQCLFSIIGSRKLGPSSSTNWELLEHHLEVIRKEGYCMNLCGIGYDFESDGYNAVMKHYHKTKGEGTLDDLFDELHYDLKLDDSNSDVAPLLRERGKEVSGDDFDSEIERIHLITDVYCKYHEFSFDECMEIKRAIIADDIMDQCVDVCLEEFSNSSLTMPEFKDMPPVKQQFEKCLDEFGGPDEFYDYQNRTSITVKDMLHILKKNGFVVIENFFPTELTTKVNDFVNSWDELGEWNNLTYSDFYSSNPNQLNEYENRTEFVLPYVEPFETVVSTIHKSILMELMSAYGSHQPINMDFPASIMSRPGAVEQLSHSDHGYSAGMLKLNVAIHNIPEISGPTSFCPCTHQHSHKFLTYRNECIIRYHPKLVKAGTVIIYDQSMRHNGMANKGDLKRRYILDLSYNVGNVKNHYTNSYPELATKHVREYREAYQNLNLVLD